MTEVTSYLKPAPAPCECGCGVTGTPRIKRNRDGTHHVRLCVCISCRNKRNRGVGRKQQAKAFDLLGLPTSTGFRPGHEEFAGGLVRWEQKHGSQSQPVITRYRRSRAQSDAARALGDHRPFVATFSYDGTFVAVIDMDELAEAVAALAEQLGLTA